MYKILNDVMIHTLYVNLRCILYYLGIFLFKVWEMRYTTCALLSGLSLLSSFTKVTSQRSLLLLINHKCNKSNNNKV